MSKLLQFAQLYIRLYEWPMVMTVVSIKMWYTLKFVFKLYMK